MRQVGYFYSRVLGIDIDFAWFGNRGRPLIMFPTSGGNHLENEDRGLVRAVTPAIDSGRLQVICINSINNDSWARKDLTPGERVRRHDVYDRFLSEELVPWLTTHAHSSELMVYGASMGGYHAVNFGARHPDQVKKVIAFSGLFDVNKVLNANGYWDDLCYFHSPVAFVPNMDASWCDRMRKVEWVIATGEHDSLVEETRRFSAILRSKGIPVTEEVWPGVFGHDWPYWQEHLPRFV